VPGWPERARQAGPEAGWSWRRNACDCDCGCDCEAPDLAISSESSSSMSSNGFSSSLLLLTFSFFVGNEGGIRVKNGKWKSPTTTRTRRWSIRPFLSSTASSAYANNSSHASSTTPNLLLFLLLLFFIFKLFYFYLLLLYYIIPQNLLLPLSLIIELYYKTTHPKFFRSLLKSQGNTFHPYKTIPVNYSTLTFRNNTKTIFQNYLL